MDACPTLVESRRAHGQPVVRLSEIFLGYSAVGRSLRVAREAHVEISVDEHALDRPTGLQSKPADLPTCHPSCQHGVEVQHAVPLVGRDPARLPGTRHPSQSDRELDPRQELGEHPLCHAPSDDAHVPVMVVNPARVGPKVVRTHDQGTFLYLGHADKPVLETFRSKNHPYSGFTLRPTPVYSLGL